MQRRVHAPGRAAQRGPARGRPARLPWHGWMYDVRSGECVMPARGARVVTYPVTIEHGEIWVEVP